jgi:hypothetical protein
MTDSSEQTVDFLGYQINCVQDDDGTPYVPLKWLCEFLGIDDNRQRRDVRSYVGFNWKMVSVKGADGRHRKMFCLPLEQMYFWIYTVNSNKVRPEIKERLLAFHEESPTALRHTRQYGLTFNPRSSAEKVERRVREFFERLLQERCPDGLDTMDRKLAVLQAELKVFGQFEHEAPPYREKALECIAIATDRWDKWLVTPPDWYRQASSLH